MTLSDFDARVLAAVTTGHESAVSARWVAFDLIERGESAGENNAADLSRKVASALGRLRARGMVERDSDPLDGRPVWCRYDSQVAATREAREALAAAEAARPCEAQAQALDWFGPDGVHPRDVLPNGYGPVAALAREAQAEGLFYRASALWRIAEARAKTGHGRRTADRERAACRAAINGTPVLGQNKAPAAPETDHMSESEFVDWAQDREAAQNGPRTAVQVETAPDTAQADREALTAAEAAREAVNPEGLTFEEAREILADLTAEALAYQAEADSKRWDPGKAEAAADAWKARAAFLPVLKAAAPVVREFGSTGAAYNATQCDESIQNGAALVIPSESVVGLAWTWPVAVTYRPGDLHSVQEGVDPETVGDGRAWTRAQILAAVAEALTRGFPLAQEFETFREAAVATFGLHPDPAAGRYRTAAEFATMAEAWDSDAAEAQTRPQVDPAQAAQILREAAQRVVDLLTGPQADAEAAGRDAAAEAADILEKALAAAQGPAQAATSTRARRA